MKIILTLSDMAPSTEEILIEWFKVLINDKNPENTFPLRYVEKLEVENGI